MTTACRQCGNLTANEARIGELSWAVCDAACGSAFARECVRKQLVARWGTCELWQRPEGPLDVRLSSSRANRAIIFHPNDLRADDRRDLRSILEEARTTEGLFVANHDALEALESKCLL